MNTDLSSQSEHVLRQFLLFMVVGGFACFVLAIGAGVLLFRGTERSSPPTGSTGTSARGESLVTRYGCPACHLVPGAAPPGMVGPPLTRFGSRSYIAGIFTNEPIRLEQWIEHPQAMKPGTAMPDLGVNERDARDIAAYLTALK